MAGVFLLGLLNSHATESPKCDNAFEQRDALKEEAQTASNDTTLKTLILRIISLTITATETYLNNCTDSKIPLSEQTSAINKLDEMAKVTCYSDSTSAIQLINVNNDAISELLLHAKVLEGEDDPSGTCYAGVTILFFLNSETGKWAGSPIWPIDMFKKKPEEMQVKDLINTQYHPKIYMIDLQDKHGKTYMAIENYAQGGDSSTNSLSVVRIDGRHFHSILNLTLNDWCGQSNRWILEKNGIITVPEAKATERCGKRKRAVYNLEHL